MVYVKPTKVVVVKPFMCRGELVAAGTVLNPGQIAAIKRLDVLVSNGVLDAQPDPYSRRATRAGTSKPTHVHHDVLADFVDDVLTADFTATPTDLDVVFDGSGSTATNTITDWKWDFGDLSAQVTEQDDTANHSYSSAGTYTVQLWVKNSLGQWSDPFSDDVTVTAP